MSTFVEHRVDHEKLSFDREIDTIGEAEYSSASRSVLCDRERKRRLTRATDE